MRLLLLVLIGGLCSFQFLSKETRKIISDDQYNYEFYVTDHKLTVFKENRQYYWYRLGEIHQSQSGANGALLQGRYTKSYRGAGIAEEGFFEKGIKHHRWSSWYQNGTLKEVTYWREGLRSGTYTAYSDQGVARISGKYSRGKKHGRWIDYQTQDTTYFKQGEKVVEKPKKRNEKTEKPKKEGWITNSKAWFQKVFRKKTAAEKAAKKRQRELKKRAKKQQKPKTNIPPKQSN
ncbi:hypothetical protein HN014_04545 [Aquimarina sp. TRL1]|uniref:toxin-antitoxin system YwqK family antitoxin n=1 Tax=Aquimarina sp. (strain TRL1) TaxID=2736252 RepID=UPI00158A2098|nr:hypothetical protein [Aquimarina sp. TRL1]QKX04207.1 hypothetical protein HN014_04545 [Aquimarina sp. TRL1]